MWVPWNEMERAVVAGGRCQEYLWDDLAKILHVLKVYRLVWLEAKPVMRTIAVGDSVQVVA